MECSRSLVAAPPAVAALPAAGIRGNATIGAARHPRATDA
jgi:hypothetical protein